MDPFLSNKKYLFRRIATGDEDAFREVFHACNRHKIYPFVFKLTHSKAVAEDIVQETFLRLWIHREEVGEMEYPLSWLYKVASNLSLSWLRSHTAEIRRMQKMKTAVHTKKERVVEQLSFKETQVLLSQAVKKLPPRRKQIYKLSREQGLSHQEIAEQLQLSPNTIKNQMVSALKFIKNYLHQYGGITVPILILFVLSL